mgnify:CR=1 FL=1
MSPAAIALDEAVELIRAKREAEKNKTLKTFAEDSNSFRASSRVRSASDCPFSRDANWGFSSESESPICTNGPNRK